MFGSFIFLPAGIEQCHFIAWEWRDAGARQGISGTTRDYLGAEILNSAFAIATVSVQLRVWREGCVGAEGLWGGQGCWAAVDARSSLLAEPWWHPPARGSARPGSGSEPPGFVPFHGHPNGFGAQHEAWGPAGTRRDPLHHA